MYNFVNVYVKAHVGESPTLHFTVKSQPLNAQHILKTEDGKIVTERFFVKENMITFEEVRKEDSGIYTISCRNVIGTGKSKFELEVVGELRVLSTATRILLWNAL